MLEEQISTGISTPREKWMGIECFVRTVLVVSKSFGFWSMIKIFAARKAPNAKTDRRGQDEADLRNDVNADGRARRRIFISFWHRTQMTSAVARARKIRWNRTVLIGDDRTDEYAIEW